jgi:hypothetical protein
MEMKTDLSKSRRRYAWLNMGIWPDVQPPKLLAAGRLWRSGTLRQPAPRAIGVASPATAMTISCTYHQLQGSLFQSKRTSKLLLSAVRSYFTSLLYIR